LQVCGPKLQDQRSWAKKDFARQNRIDREKLVLTRPFDKHLDSDELDGLVSSHAASVTDLGRLSEQALGEAQRHVESCQDCGRKVQMHKSVQSEIARMGVPSNMPLGSDCIADSDWLNVAAGLLPEAKTRELMMHAAQCGHCGPLLKNAVETLADEVTPSEETLLASLSSARPEWQRNMASTLRGNVQDRKKPSWWRAMFAWPAPAYAFAGIAAIAIVAWIGVRTLHPPSAEQLLAQAYTEHRVLDVRISGAKYAPTRVERSERGSSLDRSASLIKAEALISENLAKTPNDPTWLQAKARADVLDGNFEPALKSLQRALEVQPDSPSLLADMATAYFERAEAANGASRDGKPVTSPLGKSPGSERAEPSSGAIDYGNAVEALGKVLAKSPNDPVALFNRAIVCEKIFLYTQAVDDWEHYLRVDPQSDWAEEARKRLAAVKEKLKEREKTLAEPLLTPEEITHAGTNDAINRETINRRVEDYLRLAVADWLPKAFSNPTSGQSRDAKTALAFLATITQERHADYWLADLLSHTSGVQFRAAISALANSIRANEHGDYAEGRNSAHSAAQLFRIAANPAGELRAQAEEVYSDHLLYEGERCLSLIHSVYPPLERNSYPWLRAQMSLEESNCANLVGDLGTYQTAINRGTGEAKTHDYRALYLRGAGFRAQAAASLGDANRCFSLASEGLSRFWSSQVDIMKGYNLYTDLDTAADNLHLPNLQVVLWREATALIDRHPDVLQRAMAHRWYGNAAYLANMPTLARGEFAKASALFADAPQTAATIRARMDAEIWLAELETRQGDLDRAAARLHEIQPVLDGSPSFVQAIRFYNARANIGIHRADSAATESALKSAIYLAEWALHSFPAEADRRQWAEQTSTAYRNLVEWKLRQGDANSALELWEWYRGAELRAGERDASHVSGTLDVSVPPDPRDAPPLPSPTAVRDRLPLLREETVVAFGAFPHGIAIWTYDDRGVVSRWISTPLPPVQELALRFQRLCSDPSSDLLTLRKTGRSLYDLLIAPVEGRLQVGRTLVFEPDDFLSAIPWEALVDPTSRYLAERATVVVTPGLYRAMHLRPATAITGDSSALIVSVPAPLGMTPLADAQDEAQTVAQRFSSAHWLQSDSATLSAIRREIRGASVFHFAGHAVASPLRTGLVLSDVDPRSGYSRLIGGESLAPGDIDSLQLAVLSACHTSANSEIGRSGTETFAQSLLYAGVPHVVASRWNVDSRETAEFMNRFYARLLTGSDVATSMRTAQLALASQPASAHPYYWSAFELQGIR
jgi:CHAT domain-containing protein/tetratricopeptide (TPR) repeat protein